jgi:hypothetical protein
MRHIGDRRPPFPGPLSHAEFLVSPIKLQTKQKTKFIQYNAIFLCIFIYFADIPDSYYSCPYL